jgi:glyoxylase-like metal-dependent hydrolase (beta-lactamase superfamily II)
MEVSYNEKSTFRRWNTDSPHVCSHWHFDHIGDMSKFPTSVNIVVGPGFKENLLPGFPLNPESALLESDYM